MLRLSAEQLADLSAFKSCFVERPIITQILSDFDRLRTYRELGGDQQCMLLTGDTGSGKSHLINYYKERFHKHQIGNVLTCPILVSRIPSRLDLEQTMIQLLYDLGQFGSDYRKRRSNDIGLTESLVALLKQCQTELIIINEFQELIEFKNAKSRQAIANRFKYISEEACVPIVFVGMPWAECITEEPQWASRLIFRRQLPYFKLSEDLEEFVRFLKGLALRMPFEVTPRIEDKRIVFPLFYVSRGEIRKLKHLLNEAVAIALELRAETLLPEHLFCAFSLFYPGEQNPFGQDPSKLKFSEVKCYSTYNANAVAEAEALVATRFTEGMSLTQLLKK
ncbi:TniB family NTP-binding protein [Pontibacterium granulatum]|uniref:TniB family NTP-binding protein n=1 Tax=Pontibacterium granulatum TaxID=2036029 RepID=UPI002499B04D|nr:TniB family NTP-binding protein [Pontibacterium granulatum]MDI3326528.1 TniB family NTP-binding protein [Pontibacterium granulatum]